MTLEDIQAAFNDNNGGQHLMDSVVRILVNNQANQAGMASLAWIEVLE